jgi:inositol 1,4,5-triphosphate receptor type 3
VDYGVRSGGGGIGDQIPGVSFNRSPEVYAEVFFYNVIFFIIIVLILGNVFLGIIVDTFAELRDTKQKSDNDKNNICFICQLARDKATARNIDFDDHTNKIHNVWNYVNFITYLLTTNPYNFNKLEYEILDKFKNNDITWIPLEEALKNNSEEDKEDADVTGGDNKGNEKEDEEGNNDESEVNEDE